MVQTLHPDVYIQEVSGVPTIIGVSTAVAGFVGTALKGPTNSVGLVTSYPDFVNQYGEGYAEGYPLEYAVWGFFANGGQQAFIAGIKGPGAAAASLMTNSLGGAPTPASESSVVGPFDLSNGQTLVIRVNGGATQTFTFTGARAIVLGGSPTLPPAASSTLDVTIDGFPQQVVFAGTETTVALAVAAINAQLNHGRAVVDTGSGFIDIESDIEGSAAEVIISGGTALTALGLSTTTVHGSGNVPNINVVQVADAIAVLVGLTQATATSEGGELVLTSISTGASATIQVTNASTAVAFGFDNLVHSGTAAGSSDPFFEFTELFLGSDGNNVAISTLRYSINTTEPILNGATTAVVDDMTHVQLGDIVTISDGVTTVNVHVFELNIGTRTIYFDPISIGATIASGATVNCASSHRANTTLAAACLATATVINVTSASQMHVGTLLSFDDGTNLAFATVTKVNGNQLTLNQMIGFAYAQGVLVATQSVDITEYYNGSVTNTYQFISWEPTDEIDWIEVRLQGVSNQSSYITGISLNPPIAIALNNRPAPVGPTFLTGGLDGSTPADSDYIGSDVVPKTGIYLFDEVNSIDLLAIPGIETQAVQETLCDYCTLRADVMAVGATPQADDQALEAINYLQTILNRDTSYAALYFPWLIVTDRHAPSGLQNPQITVSPEGYVMGLMALTDNQFNVATSPANAPLLDVISLTHFTSDDEHNLLNPVGINVIRTFPGEGIQVMGARTLSKTFDGRQYICVRRLLLYVEKSLKQGLRTYVFKPNDPSTWRKVTSSVTTFLGGIWKAGMLYPSNNFDDAQFVTCNQSNNPPETRNLGQMFVDVGVNPPLPAEFIVVRVGLYDGTASVQETSNPS